jgi:hypothetical protein
MIILLTLLLGFSWLIFQQLWMALKAEWEVWGSVLRRGFYTAPVGRYKPHETHLVIFSA